MGLFSRKARQQPKTMDPDARLDSRKKYREGVYYERRTGKQKRIKKGKERVRPRRDPSKDP